SAAELAPLTELSDARSLAAIAQTACVIALAIGLGVWGWPSPWLALAVVIVGVEQHALFILAHEAAHYRLLRNRALNDGVGRAIGMVTGISMCTYRIIHRLHHNHLFGAEDPDIAIHGGYPRGVAYLWKKLAQDLVGWNAWKTFAYFFGAPAVNDEVQRTPRPLGDTSPRLRRAAGRDRWFVLALQLALLLACGVLGGWRGLAQYAVLWLLPLVTVQQPILRLRAICEHGGVVDMASPLTAARCNRTTGGLANAIGRALLFPHHVNHHLEHHLYPAVPHYRLRALHRALAAKGAFADAEVRDVRETLAIVFAPPRGPRVRVAAEVES
ncbi:MAG: fatty acid desaturase family protein, partial [Rhizobacter sp.]|nr:fatty acid desaturase family protein [Rhizobacter sp.]